MISTKGRIFLFITLSKLVVGPNHPVETEGSFLGVKWLECEANYYQPSSAEVNNAWCFTSTSF
jgi:hypothetical protein